MKVDIYTLSKNEIDLCPFMVDYWKSMGDEVNVYVYDGMSTDGTREYLSQYDWVHIIDFEVEGGLNDKAHMDLKNSCWKQSKGKADWVIVCDFDEVIATYDNIPLKNILNSLDKNTMMIIPLSFYIVADEFPKYTEGKFLHELCKYGYNDYQWGAKPILFNPNLVEENNSCLGGHWANPIGDGVISIDTNIFMVHCKYVGFDYFRARLEHRTMSEWNIQNNLLGDLYHDDQEKYYIDTYNEIKAKRFNWFDIKDNFAKYYETIVDWRYWGLNMYITVNDLN